LSKWESAFSGRKYLQPGFKENAKPPLFSIFLARDLANNIFAVFDCPYASHSL